MIVNRFSKTTFKMHISELESLALICFNYKYYQKHFFQNSYHWNFKSFNVNLGCYTSGLDNSHNTKVPFHPNVRKRSKKWKLIHKIMCRTRNTHDSLNINLKFFKSAEKIIKLHVTLKPHKVFTATIFSCSVMTCLYLIVLNISLTFFYR